MIPQRIFGLTLLTFFCMPGYSQNECSTLSKIDQSRVNITLKMSTWPRSVQSDVAWGPSLKFEQPHEVSDCFWSIILACRIDTRNAFKCEEWDIRRIEYLFEQLRMIQPPCEFVRDAQPVLIKSPVPSLRARLCLASAMQGGDLKCLANERKTFSEAYRKGFNDGERGTDAWLYSLLSLPAPVYAPLLPWLQSLPDKSKSRRLILAKKLAIAAHKKDYAGFLALCRDTDTFFSNELSKWGIYYFPNVDWQQEILKLRLPRKQQALLQGTFKFAKEHQNLVAYEINQSEANYCRMNSIAS